MAERIQEIGHTVSNLGIGSARSLLLGIRGTRDYLRSIGATGGLDWSPLVRSRLYAEMRLASITGKLTNKVGGVALIGAMDQSFAPTIPQAVGRFRGNPGTAIPGERIRRLNRNQKMPLGERVRRLGQEVLLQRGTMPPTMRSLKTLKRIAQKLDVPFANLYPEELPQGQVFTHQNAPYKRVAQLSPDLLEGLGVHPDNIVTGLPVTLKDCGIHQLSFSAYNAERKSQSGNTQLPHWSTYLADFARQGLIRQIAVSFNRNDLPGVTGQPAMDHTYTVADELIRERADPEYLGELPDQIKTIVDNHPAHLPLDFVIRGDISHYRPEQMQNAFRNLDALAGINS